MGPGAPVAKLPPGRSGFEGGGGGRNPPLDEQNFFIIGICALPCDPNTEFL